MKLQYKDKQGNNRHVKLKYKDEQENNRHVNLKYKDKQGSNRPRELGVLVAIGGPDSLFGTVARQTLTSQSNSVLCLIGI